MKLIIEISENDFAKAVNAQVSKSIALMAEKAISEKLDAILDTKTDRMIKAMMQNISKSAGDAIRGTVKKRKKP